MKCTASMTSDRSALRRAAHQAHPGRQDRQDRRDQVAHRGRVGHQGQVGAHHPLLLHPQAHHQAVACSLQPG